MDILSEFAVKVYRPPLSELRDSGRIGDTSDVVCAAMLVVDFETEVTMSGIVDFIGNSTGRFATETVAALELIGCTKEAECLRRILAAAAVAGMTHEAIQRERAGLELFAITSFSRLHGSKWDDVVKTIDEVFDTIDLSTIMLRLAAFMDRHQAVFEKAIGRASA